MKVESKNKAIELANSFKFINGTHRTGFIEGFKHGSDWAEEQFKPKWIMETEKESHLKDGDRCWIEMDYSEWGRKEKRVVIANVHFTNIPQGYGGPNSLTGSGYLTGIYFSLPAICNPDSVKRFCKIEKPKDN